MQLLDLFVLDSDKSQLGYGPGESSQNSSRGGSTDLNCSQLLGIKGPGLKNLLENLPELWDESQYESEYDLNNFMSSLKK